MARLITPTIIKANITLPCSFADEAIEKYIDEAQDVDLSGCLGRDFVDDLETNTGSAYDPLITLSDFQKMLSFFSYARWVAKGSFVATNEGLFVKETDTYEPITDKRRDKLESEALALAAHYKSRVDDYLNDNEDDLDLTNWKGCAGDCGPSTFKPWRRVAGD